MPTRIEAAAQAPKVAGGASLARIAKLTNARACEASIESAAMLPPRTTTRVMPPPVSTRPVAAAGSSP